MSRCVAIIQARLNSSRLPRKVLLPVGNNTILQLIVKRIKKCKNIDEIVVATSEEKSDDELANICESYGVRVFRGKNLDVLSRFTEAARYFKANTIVRLTGDSPLVDPLVIDIALENFKKNNFDYYSNVIHRTFPDGLDFEIFTQEALEITNKNSITKWEREHVTVFMRTNSDLPIKTGNFNVGHFLSDYNFSHLRWTIDTLEDYEFFKELSKYGIENKSWKEIIIILTQNPELLIWNRNHKKRIIAGEKTNKTYKKGFKKSIDHLNKSLKTIPIGSQTFSKSYMGWVLGKAPLYAKSGYGCEIIDLDGNNFIDYIMALMPVVLGYSDSFVDSAVVKQLKYGTSLSLSSELEAQLSEMLVKLIPCAEMVRFGKNGSDVTTAAIRLARAYTAKDKVIVCGYHGWHDWFIGTTEKNLGVPKEIKELSISVPYNNIDFLKKTLSNNKGKIACIIIEATGKVEPSKRFLKEVRDLCNKQEIILIFDEVISGFRVNIGGAQKEYSVIPDLACFGKAMANGYPISALVGKRKIMDIMQNIFFSTTFGGEVASIAAAISTIEKLIDTNAIEKIKNTGKQLKDEINEIILKQKLDHILLFKGENWWPRIDFNTNQFEQSFLSALLRQEFCKNGLLIASSLNISLSHSNEYIIKETIKKAKTSIISFSNALKLKDPKKALEGNVIFSDFNVRNKLKKFGYGD